MARMLTEEEVEQLEKQRELRDRARAAGSTNGMSWDERQRFRDEQERKMWDQRYRETHGGLSKAEVQAAGPNGSGRQYAAIKRGFELQAARAHELKMQGEELATRRKEAEEKKLGMIGQGKDAAEANRDATIQTAKLQTASAEKIAGINSQRDKDVATIQGKNALEVEKERGGANVEVAQINKEGSVEAAQVTASAQAKSEYAQRLMRQRAVDDETAWKHASEVEAKALQLMKKSGGKLSLEEARKRVKEGMREPGKKREWNF